MEKDTEKVIELNSPKPVRDILKAVYQCKTCGNPIYTGDYFYKWTTVEFCIDCNPGNTDLSVV